MAKKNYWGIISIASILAITSCVDDNYNLSDIDTTVGISVNELTIPLNVDEIVLEKVLDLEEDSRIKEVEVKVKKIYAIVEEGTFKSEKIEIPGFTAEGIDIDPIEEKLQKNLVTAGAPTRGAIRNEGQATAYYPISNIGTSFNFSGNVDKAVKGIKKIMVDTKFSMTFDVSEDKFFIDNIDKLSLENLKVKLPKGLEGTITVKTMNGGKEVKFDATNKYNKVTGIISGIEAEYLSTEDGIIKLEIDIDAIDLTIGNNEVKATRSSYTDSEEQELIFKDGKFEFKGNILVEKGEVAVYSENLKGGITFENLPQEMAYKCIPEMEEIVVKQVNGEVEYKIEGINIDPVKMNDIPDILNQKGTDIKLANPQIYLMLNNPLAKNNLRAEAGLELVAKRNNNDNKTAVSEKLYINKTNNIFCLTSNKNFPVEEMHKEYKDAEIIEFNDLDNILSGDGLPSEIEINVMNPEIPLQTITDFELDQNIEEIQGTYLFFAPLALKDASSVIVYKETIDDWYDETFDKLEISNITINANVESDIPLTLELSFYPIDVNGKKIDVDTTPVTIEAKKTSQPIEISVKGNIKKLDGVTISAKLKGNNGEALSPDHKISLDKLKVTVSGNYIDKL